MPINYGTNDVSTSGTIKGNIGGLLDRKVLYFGTGTGTWDISSNWYYDKDLTLSANAVPTSEDTAIIGGSAYVSSAGSGISAYNIILRDSSTFSVSSQTIMVKNIVLYDSSYISVSSCTLGSASDRCDLQFYDSSYLSYTSSASFYGDFSMYDDSYTSVGSHSNSFYGNVTIKCNPSNSGKGLHSTNGLSSIYGELYVAGNSGYSFGNSTVSYVIVWGKTNVTFAILDSCTLNNTEINYATINSSTIYGNVSAVDYSYIYSCYLFGTALLSDNSQVSSSTVYAPLYLTSYSTATSSTLYGSVYLSDSANISNTTFYGSVEIVRYSWISGGTFESCNVFVTQHGYITGSTYFNGNSIIKIGYEGYIYNSSTIYLNDSSRLILSSNNTSGTMGSVNITGDVSTDGSVVEVHNLACLGSSSTINCATLEFRGPNVSGGLSSSSITLGTLKKIKLFDTSYVGSSITTPQDCIIEFHDRSYLSNSVTLTLGTNGVAKFHDTSYNNGGTITGGSLVEFYDTSNNQSGSIISTPKAIFYGNSSIDNVTLDKTAVSLIYRNIPTQLTPPSIGSTQDNYDPGFADILRLEAQSPSQDIRGFVLKDRYLVVIVNVGSSYNLILKHQDSNSTDVNRFITPTGGDHTILPEGTTSLMYDTATTRWRVL